MKNKNILYILTMIIASFLCGAQLKKSAYAANGTMPVTSNSIKHTIRTLKAGAKTSFESMVSHNSLLYIAGQGVDSNGFPGFLLTRYALQKDGTYDIDTTFGSDGVVITKIGKDAKAHRIMKHQLSNGSLVFFVTGYGTSTDGNRCMAATCYTVDGKLDTTFGSQGIILIPVTQWSEAHGIAIAPDDTIFIAGTSNQTPQDASKAVATVACCNKQGILKKTWGDKGILFLSMPATTFCDSTGKTIISNVGNVAQLVPVITTAGIPSSACGVVVNDDFLYIGGQGIGQNAVNLQLQGSAKSKSRVNPFVACYRAEDGALNQDFKVYHYGVVGESTGGFVFPNISNDSQSGFVDFTSRKEELGFELYGVGYVFSTNETTPVNAPKGTQVRSIIARMDSKGVLKTGLGAKPGPLFNNGVLQTYLVDQNSTFASNPSKMYGTAFTYYTFKNNTTSTAANEGLLLTGYGTTSTDTRNHMILTRYIVNFSSKNWDLDITGFAFKNITGLAGSYSGNAQIYTGNNDWDLYGRAICAENGIIIVAGTAQKDSQSLGIVAFYDGMHGMPLLRNN